jgi:hypothetical protein
MEKKKLSVNVGNKLLTLDNEKEVDPQFKREFKAVAKTNPKNLQEFFERLVEIQAKNSQKNKARVIRDERTVKNKKNKL